MKEAVPVFFGNVENGKFKLELDSDGRFREYLKSLNGRVEMIVRKWRRTRSNQQNRYYWGVVIAIAAEHFGYSPYEMHQAFKVKFLYVPEETQEGKIIKPATIGSTKEMNTMEFNRYFEDIRMWMSSEFGVYIPDPNEVDLSTIAWD